MAKKNKIRDRTLPAPIVRSVYVPGERRRRKVFYVQREMLFDKKGRVCHTPLELGMMLANALSARNKEAVAGICWDALNFVHDGDVPKDWLGVWKKAGPTPLAI